MIFQYFNIQYSIFNTSNIQYSVFNISKVGAPPGLIFPRILLGTTNALILVTAFVINPPARLDIASWS